MGGLMGLLAGHLWYVPLLPHIPPSMHQTQYSQSRIVPHLPQASLTNLHYITPDTTHRNEQADALGGSYRPTSPSKRPRTFDAATHYQRPPGSLRTSVQAHPPAEERGV